MTVEFTMYDLESIWHGVVITLKSPERCQNLVINTSKKLYFVKWVFAIDQVVFLYFKIL